MGRSHATLEDVAKLAGVSTATVSRCLNTPARVRDETRKRVQNAVDQLGYTPHFAGQALASNRTNTFGAIIPTMENAIFAQGLQTMEEALAEAGVTLLVASSNYDPDKERAQIRSLAQRGVDGLLLIGHARPDATYEALRRLSAPLVLAWSLPPDRASSAPHCVVGFDNRRAAEELAAHVLSFGHREIAMIAGRAQWNDRAADRIAGVEAAAHAGGARLRGRLVEASYSFEAAEAAFEEIMTRARRPTAVICGNDVLAAGALRAARRRGARVPQDLSIVGFDDIDLAEIVEPALTTVRAPHRRMGRIAAERLLQLRDGVAAPPITKLETRIVSRRSLGPAP